MKEYAVQIKIKNNFLLERMRGAGFETAAELSRASGISQSELGELLNFKVSALTKSQVWRKAIIKLSEVLRCMPEDLVPPQHWHARLQQNTAEVVLGDAEIHGVMLGAADRAAGLLPDANLNRTEISAAIMAALGSLTPQQERVLRLRFGLNGVRPHTLEEVGEQLGVSKERVRQFEARAFRELRHPSMKKKMRGVFSDIVDVG